MGERLFRHRLAVMFAAFALALASAVWSAGGEASPWVRPAWGFGGEEARAAVLAFTGALCLAAFALRTWGEAWLGGAVYGQGETERLVDGGPFARTRNPLYLGTWLFFFATVLGWAPWWVWLVGSTLFFAALDAMVRHEERLLRERLGAAYLAYVSAVPRWWPTGAGTARLPAPPARAWAAGALANLGFGSMGLYRLAVAAGAPPRGVGALNLACLAVWLGVVAVRRLRRR